VLLAVLAASALVAAGVAIVAAVNSDDTPAPVPVESVPRRSVAVIDPARNVVVDAIRLQPRPVATPVQPTDVAVGFGAVWVSDRGQQTVLRIDPRTREVSRTIGVGADVQAVAVGFGSVWLAGGNSATVTRIDPRTDRVTATIRLGRSGQKPNTTFAIAAAAGSVWATGGDSLVLRLDPRTDRVVERVEVGDPRTLAGNTRFVWCGTRGGRIFRIEPHRDGARVTRFASTGSDDAGAMAVRGPALWVARPGPRFELWQYDTDDARLASTLGVGEIVLDVAVAPHAVWVPLYREGEVLEVDARRNTVAHRFVTRPATSFVAVGEGAIWAVVA
jgi:hypothetical protein